MLPLAAIVGLAADRGGYFPTSWSWVALGACWAAVTAAIVRSAPRVSSREAVYAYGLLFLTGWSALSTVWSGDPDASMLEAERLTLYAAVVLGAIVLVPMGSKNLIAAAISIGTTAVAAFALATRLAPDQVGVFDSTSGYRLAAPIGYWNGLAIFCVIGALVTLGAAAHARSLLLRGAGAAAIVVLVTTLYYTYGRAPWIALAIGLVALCAVETRRLWLVTTTMIVAIPSAAAVAVASRPTSLTTTGATLVRAAHDGHRVGLFVVALAAAAGVGVATASVVAPRIGAGRHARDAYGFVLAAIVLAAVAYGIVAGGGPAAIARNARTAFVASPPRPADLNERLFNFSGNGRADLWRLAWNQYRTHETLGAGAGSYGRYFLAHQPSDVGTVTDAHNLYLETLTEVGPVGLAALAVVLLSPLAAVAAARRARLVPAAVGAYAAFLVHSAVDWDWELAAVSIPALLAGSFVLLAARPGHRISSAWTRVAVIAPTVALAGFSLVALIGNSALASSDTATQSGKALRAETYARRAETWMPWSADPLRALGAAQRTAGDRAAALASFRKAAALDDGDWRVWYGIALTSAGRQRRVALARARALFRQGNLKIARGAGGSR